jgi:hypothetical protein
VLLEELRGARLGREARRSRRSGIGTVPQVFCDSPIARSADILESAAILRELRHSLWPSECCSEQEPTER